MKTFLGGTKARVALWTAAIYLASYPLVWGMREDVMYCMTDHGCFRRVSQQFSVRYDCIEYNPRLRAAVSFIYHPLNALRRHARPVDS